jgi:hypothetical protein
MKIGKIKEAASALFTFVRYTLFMIFSLIAVVSFLFALTFFIGMIGCYQQSFTGFCISFGTLIVTMLILGLLNVEAGEWGGLF